ncbi:MAG TPA: CvpA family protein [Phycisphaerales bacterium]|nr:CvpA family protein [Phycisphaerales bacterium]
MFMSLVSIAIVLGLAYLWSTRGFFSSLIHMACVVAAGAIAFGVWEPLSMLILTKAPSSGFLSFISDGAWGLGLALPFVISLVILRVITDKLVKGNVAIDDTYNFIGAGLCGVVTGVITSGMFVLSTGFLRVPANFMGYQPVQMVNQGNLEIQQKLWLPVDRLTASFYNALSTRTLSTDTPLVKYYPDLASAAGTQRMSEGNGNNKNVIKPDAFTIGTHFTVGKDKNLPADQIFTDFLNPGVQDITLLDGSPIGPGAYIDGYLIKFNSGAKEKFGQIVFGKGQIRLVVQNAQGDRKTLFPIAVTSQAKSGDDRFGRFRFDGEFYVASVGGASEAPMAFEFAVPAGYTPQSLYVRNLRIDVEGKEPDREFPDAAARDAAIQTGALLAGNRTENLNLSHAQTVPVSGGRGPGVSLQTRLENRIVLQKGQTHSLEIDEHNFILNGEQAFAPNEFAARGLDRALRVDQFFVTPDTNIIQIKVTGDPAQVPTSYFSTSAAPDLRTDVPPMLIDTKGQSYEAIGFIYSDNNISKIRYTPGRPMRGLNEADSLVRSRDDQEMYLIFRPSVGVDIKYFAIGDVVLATFDPPLHVDPPRKR